MARTYKRDSRGRFAGGSGGGGGRSSVGGKTAPKAASQPRKPVAAKKPKARGIEARLERSSQVQLGYNRRSRAAGVVSGTRGMTPERLQHMGKRKQQQKQAIANLYGKLSPANQSRAMKKMKRSGIMNG
jgi:hypothetical protein